MQAANACASSTGMTWSVIDDDIQGAMGQQGDDFRVRCSAANVCICAFSVAGMTWSVQHENSRPEWIVLVVGNGHAGNGIKQQVHKQDVSCTAMWLTGCCAMHNTAQSGKFWRDG